MCVGSSSGSRVMPTRFFFFLLLVAAGISKVAAAPVPVPVTQSCTSFPLVNGQLTYYGDSFDSACDATKNMDGHEDGARYPSSSSCGYYFAPPSSFIVHAHSISCSSSCPRGYILSIGECIPYSETFRRSSLGSPCPPSPFRPETPCLLMEGNPINVSSGNKYQVETDFTGGGSRPLQFKRYYNSSSLTVDSRMGKRWRHSFDKAIVASRIPAANPSVNLVEVLREDGKGYNFVPSGDSGWKTDSDVVLTLTMQTNGAGAITGWLIRNADGELEEYDASGRWISLQARAGYRLTLTYNADGSLARVVDLYGRSLSFFYYPATGALGARDSL